MKKSRGVAVFVFVESPLVGYYRTADDDAKFRNFEPVGAAALPPMPEEEVQKEDMQEVVHARPPRVVLFAAASREESMSWLQACAERGATLEALALASLDRDCDCECVRSFLPPDI